MNLLVTFHSVSAALYAQRLMDKSGVVSTVVPVPRSVSSSCGYALESARIGAEELAARLNEGDVEWERIYRKETGGPADSYSRLLDREEEETQHG